MPSKIEVINEPEVEEPLEVSLEKVIDAMPDNSAGPSRFTKKEVTYEEFQKVLDETPLFMRETPKDGETNDVLEALRSLVFEGEGDEVAMNFKNHGNELYSQKTYKEAVEAYTQGVTAGPVDFDLRISLLNNRAAANLALKNYRATLKDTGAIIALSIKAGKVPPVKSLYRSGQALICLERWDEARDVVKRGREMKGEENKPEWKKLGEDVEKGQRTVEERREREKRTTLGKIALKRAIQSRGLVVVNTPSPPDNPHPPHFDPESLPIDPPLYTPPGSAAVEPWTPPPAHAPLIYPVFLLYPTYSQSDLITHFDENTTLSDHINVMFPPSPSASSGWADWDTKREYCGPNLVVYLETAHRRLLKAGRELTLREVIQKAVKTLDDGKVDGVVLRDGLLSFIVLVKGEQEKRWIEEYKRKRDQDKS